MLGEEWAVNPRDLATPDWLEVLRVWRICRGGMGYSVLPDAGGVNDQAAWLMDAFGALGAMGAEADEAARGG